MGPSLEDSLYNYQQALDAIESYQKIAETLEDTKRWTDYAQQVMAAMTETERQAFSEQLVHDLVDRKPAPYLDLKDTSLVQVEWFELEVGPTFPGLVSAQGGCSAWDQGFWGISGYFAYQELLDHLTHVSSLISQEVKLVLRSPDTDDSFVILLTPGQVPRLSWR